MDLEQRKVGILGLARSGESAALALLKRKAQVWVVDRLDADKIGAPAKRVAQAGGHLLLGDDTDTTVLDKITLLVLSPGIPNQHPLRLAAITKGLEVIGELELGYRLRSDILYLGVTGSNGKTTCTSILAGILGQAGFPGIAAGNIGTPLCSLIDDLPPLSPLGIEISSYQLRDALQFHAHVSVLLNISPDHLDVHGSWEDYVRCKAMIFQNQTPADYAVFFVDDPTVANLARDAVSKPLPFSLAKELPQGGFILDDALTLRLGDKEITLGEIDDFKLQGPHNHSNLLAAGLTALTIGIPPDIIRTAMQGFKPLPHRLEPCGELEGVLFINDSKATNVESVMMALRSQIRPVVLIAGNKDKDSDFTALIPSVKERVKAAVLIGSAAEKIYKAWRGVIPMEIIPYESQEERPVPGMAEAVRRAWELAKPGGVVLLSPACASFDMYCNYEQRGDVYKDEVARLMWEVRGE